MTKFIKIAVIPVFLFLFLFGSVQAFAEYTTNKAEFMAEYPGLTLQEFSGTNAPPGGEIFCISSFTSTTNNACVSPGVILPGLEFTSTGLGLVVSGPFRGNNSNPNNTVSVSETGSALIIFFSENQPVNVVGLDIGCFDKSDDPGCIGTFEVEVFGFGGTTIGGFEIEATDLFDSFLGISNNEQISQVRIAPLDPEAGLAVGVDAVYFGFFRNVPTMSEWGMIATVAALGLVSFMVLRRRKSAVN